MYLNPPSITNRGDFQLDNGQNYVVLQDKMIKLLLW